MKSTATQPSASPARPASLGLAAQEAGALGFRVFPIASGAKKPPLIHDWPTRASADAAVIGEWWGRWPEANIGLLCGDGLLVLDFDGQEGFKDYLRLADDVGGLPIDVAQDTPSRGMHVLLRTPRHFVAGTWKLLEYPKLDIQSARRYVVLGPSRLADGRSWVLRGDLASMPYAPDRLLTMLETRAGTGTGARALTVRNRARAREVLADFWQIDFTRLDRGQWVEVGMALRRELGDAAFPLFEWKSEEWLLATGTARHKDDLRGQWESFATGSEVTAGTIAFYRNKAVNGKVIEVPSYAAELIEEIASGFQEIDPGIEEGGKIASSIREEQAEHAAEIEATFDTIAAKLIDTRWYRDLPQELEALGIPRNKREWETDRIDQVGLASLRELTAASSVLVERVGEVYLRPEIEAGIIRPLGAEATAAKAQLGFDFISQRQTKNSVVITKLNTVDTLLGNPRLELVDRVQLLYRDPVRVKVLPDETRVLNTYAAARDNRRTWRHVEARISGEVLINEDNINLVLAQYAVLTRPEEREAGLDAMAYNVQAIVDRRHERRTQFMIAFCSRQQNIGKSNFISIFERLFGDYAIAMPARDLDNRFVGSKLAHKAMLNIYEVEKSTTGGSFAKTIKNILEAAPSLVRSRAVERKHKDMTDEVPPGLMVFATSNDIGAFGLQDTERRILLLTPEGSVSQEGLDTAAALYRRLRDETITEVMADFIAWLYRRRVSSGFNPSAAVETIGMREAVAEHTPDWYDSLRTYLEDENHIPEMPYVGRDVTKHDIGKFMRMLGWEHYRMQIRLQRKGADKARQEKLDFWARKSLITLSSLGKGESDNGRIELLGAREAKIKLALQVFKTFGETYVSE